MFTGVRIGEITSKRHTPRPPLEHSACGAMLCEPLAQITFNKTSDDSDTVTFICINTTEPFCFAG